MKQSILLEHAVAFQWRKERPAIHPQIPGTAWFSLPRDALGGKFRYEQLRGSHSRLRKK